MVESFGQSGKGCSTIEDEELRDQCNDLFKGKHSWRGYKDTDFSELFDACSEVEDKGDRLECGVTVRRGFQRIEDGRFDDSLESMHRFFVPLDKDEQKDFARRNPRLVKRLDEWANVQQASRIDDDVMRIALENN